MINPNQKFMFASYSIGCHSVVPETMDKEDLRPFRLRDAVNAFAREFRDNLRSALLEDLKTNGRFHFMLCSATHFACKGLKAYERC